MLLDKPGAAGKFRECGVYLVGAHFEPVGAGHVGPEMDKFIGFVREAAQWVRQGAMHPVEFAASVHYAFVHIHPHVDGNGRTSRLLMNLALEQFGFPPIIIDDFEGGDGPYFQALAFASNGDLRRFLRYIAAQVETTLEVLHYFYYFLLNFYRDAKMVTLIYQIHHKKLTKMSRLSWMLLEKIY